MPELDRMESSDMVVVLLSTVRLPMMSSMPSARAVGCGLVDIENGLSVKAIVVEVELACLIGSVGAHR